MDDTRSLGQGWAQPPYNMGLGDHGQKVILWDGSPLTSSPVLLDKIVCGCALPGNVVQASQAVHDLSLGQVQLRPGRTQRRGASQVLKWWGSLWGGVGSEGNCIIEVEGFEDAGSCYVRLTFNPQKIAAEALRLCGAFIWAMGARWDAMRVERWDAAVDYAAHRGLLMLDCPRHKGDALGLVAYGPETERVGYRKGSKLRVQLYDKTAERAAKGYQDETPGFITRAECQVWEGGDVLLSDLGTRSCPMPEGSCVRVLAVEPWAVHDRLHALAAMAARFLGFRYVRAKLRQAGVTNAQRAAAIIDAVCPPVVPGFQDVFAAGWARAVECSLHPFQLGLSGGKGAELASAPVPAPLAG